jgi:hypothetical protein
MPATAPVATPPVTAHTPSAVPTAAPASPPALRLRRPGLRDPRLLLGLVLVAGSVALGSAVVSGAARTVPVYVAAAPLTPGEAVDAGALAVREVRLGEAADAYVAAGALPEGDLVVVRPVGAGELVPRAALAARSDLAVRPVAVEPDGALPSDLVEGATVDLWYVPPAPRGTQGEAGEPVRPRPLATGLTVAEVSEAGASFAVGARATVHVLVPVEDLPEVLAALESDGEVEVVLVAGA